LAASRPRRTKLRSKRRRACTSAMAFALSPVAPLVNACYLVGDAVELVIGITSCLQADVVLGICPVDSDIGCELQMR
jgi:hypothetical protein